MKYLNISKHFEIMFNPNNTPWSIINSPLRLGGSNDIWTHDDDTPIVSVTYFP